MTTPIRAALYLRVSTGGQPDNDLSIADRRRQAASGIMRGNGETPMRPSRREPP